MNTNLEQIYNEYSEKFKDFATNYASSLVPKTRDEFRELLEGEYDKELKECLALELFVVRSRNRLYGKLIRAQKKLSNKEKAPLWFERILRKFYDAGLLIELINRATAYLESKEYVDEPQLELPEESVEAVSEETVSDTDEQEPENEAELEIPTDDVSEPKQEEQPNEEQQAVSEDSEIEPEEMPSENTLDSSKSLPSFFTPGGKSGKKS